jgi:hypothetical protein
VPRARAPYKKNEKKIINDSNISKNTNDDSNISENTNDDSNYKKSNPTWKISKEDVKMFFGSFLGKVANFKFRRVVDNRTVNTGIDGLARYSIPDYYFAYLSQDTEYLHEIERIRDIPFSEPVSLSLDPRKILQDAQDKLKEKVKNGDYSLDLDVDAVMKATEQKIASGKAQLDNSILAASDTVSNTLASVSAAAELPELFDANGNLVNADGLRLEDDVIQKCLPEDPPEVEENGDLTADKALIKKYLFRTLILVVTMYTTLSWAQFVFFGQHSHRSRSCLSKSNAIGCMVAHAILPDDPSLRLAESLKEIYIIGPIIAPLVDYSINFFWPRFKRWNPFQFTFKFIELFIQYIKTVFRVINETADKKLWFLTIFVALLGVNFWFFENYDVYMSQIQRFESSRLTGFLAAIFIILYLESFYTDLWGTISSVMTAILFVPPIGLIFVICYNIYLYLIMSFNTFSSMFVLLQLFLFCSLFGLFVSPSLAIIAPFWSRPKNLLQTIQQDGSQSLSIMEDGWAKLGVSLLHQLYDHCYAIIMFIWLVFMFFVFKKHIRTLNLRHNCFYYIGLSAFLLFFLKLVYHYLGKIANKNES